MKYLLPDIDIYPRYKDFGKIGQAAVVDGAGARLEKIGKHGRRGSDWVRGKTAPSKFGCRFLDGEYDDRIWANGIFHFNISCMLDDIESGKLPLPGYLIDG